MQRSPSLQSWRWCLRCCSVVVSSKGTHKEEQNTHRHKNNSTKCPKFKCNTISVSFSACSCNLVVLSSKVGDKEIKKESGDSSENVFCNCGLPAHCCQPAVAGGVIYADLWGELSTHLSLQALLLRFFLCMSLCYKLSPFQALGKVTLHLCSQACIFIYSSCGRWVFPPLL
jgi:hypothetical protein